MKITTFDVDALNIEIKLVGAVNKKWTPTDKPVEMDQWEVTIQKTDFHPHNGRGAFKTPFYTGIGHRSKVSPHRPKRPSKLDVLESLIIDIDSADGSFNDFCDNLGYDNDSMSAFNTYQTCCATDKGLRSVLTRDELDGVRAAIDERNN